MKLDPERLNRAATMLSDFGASHPLPGWQLLVVHRDRVVCRENYGFMDIERRRPVANDTVFRLYSMTKPLTSVAAMMLYEEGRLDLDDPVSKYVPAFGRARVLVGGTADAPVTRPAGTAMTILHLLNHTAGLTYGFHHATVLDGMYRKAGYEWGVPAGHALRDCVADWADLPLLFDPGTGWNYSVATDVLGHVIELVSGRSLPEFMAERLFAPMGMVDTSFVMRPDLASRLATLYAVDQAGALAPTPVHDNLFGNPGDGCFSGGGGLVSTLADYHRFVMMLLHGGRSGDRQLLGSRTVRRMATNSLPGGRTLREIGAPVEVGARLDGYGFGLGFDTLDDPAAAGSLASRGQYGWGGAASTEFWVDPAEQLAVVFMTQVFPSNSYPFRSLLERLIYCAFVD